MSRPGRFRFSAAFGIAAALAAELVIFSWLSPYFFTWSNQFNVLGQNAAVGVIAAGMTAVILTGGIDLSVGSVAAISGVTCAAILVQGGLSFRMAFFLAVAAGIASGAAAGLINGLITTRMRIPPFVATLAMLTIARGVALHATGARTISGLPEEFGVMGGGILPVVVMAAVYLGGWILLCHTVRGREIYAVGGNAAAARLSGIDIKRVLTAVYLLSGTLAGLAGVMIAGRLNSGYPNAGMLYELDAIAAVVVGGTSLMGGRGSIWGTLAGALVIGELNNGLNLLHVEYYSQKIVVGLVLIVAACLDRSGRENS